MKSRPYALFIKRTAATYIQERRPHTGQPQAILAWLKAYGITAARVDAFLRLSREHSATVPSALVMDILELGNSKVRETLKDEYLLSALLHTWGALAEVYGRAATPADREVASHFTHSFIKAPTRGRYRRNQCPILACYSHGAQFR